MNRWPNFISTCLFSLLHDCDLKNSSKDFLRALVVTTHPDTRYNSPQLGISISCSDIYEWLFSRTIYLSIYQNISMPLSAVWIPQIRDGDQGYSPLINKFCGSNFPPIITSSGGSLWLRWTEHFTVDITNCNFRTFHSRYFKLQLRDWMCSNILTFSFCSISGSCLTAQLSTMDSGLFTISFQILSKAFHSSPSVSLRSAAPRTTSGPPTSRRSTWATPRSTACQSTAPGSSGRAEIKVHTKVRNHGEGP